MPWRNGGGTTSEIAVEPAPGGRFRHRLSIADVTASGPFSDFAGYDRHILLLAGRGFTLRVDGDAPRVVDRATAGGSLDVVRLAAGEAHEGSVLVVATIDPAAPTSERPAAGAGRRD
jgi:hypothetical protein